MTKEKMEDKTSSQNPSEDDRNIREELGTGTGPKRRRRERKKGEDRTRRRGRIFSSDISTPAWKYITERNY